MTVLIDTAISNAKGKARWLEPYTSEALNRQMYNQGNWGIREGFNLVPTSGLNVKLQYDPSTSRSVANVPDRLKQLCFAFVEDAEPTFDLTAYAGQRVYILLYVNYTIGAASAYSYRVVNAAELVNSWVQSAIMLGSVRVPGVGAIAQKDIDLGQTLYIGAGSNGSKEWVKCNTNPEFDRGLAGYELTGSSVAGAFELRSLVSPGYIGADALGLGESTGASTLGMRSGIKVVVPSSKAGDKILVRFWAKSSLVSGAQLNLKIDGGALFNSVMLAADQASFDSYGVLVTVPADARSVDVDLEVVFPAAGNTGAFVVDSFEVLKLRRSVHDGNAPLLVGAREFSVGAATNNKPSIIKANAGSMSLKAGNSSLALELTETGYTEPPNAQSAMRLLGRAYNTTEALNNAFPEHCFGGIVTRASATTVDVSGDYIRAVNSASKPDESMWFDATGVNGLAVPTTGDGVLIVYEPEEAVEANRYKALDLGVTAFILGRYTLLAYVYYDPIATDITQVIDLRYSAEREHRKTRLVVGSAPDSSSNMSLAGALKLCEIASTRNYATQFEIIIRGALTLTEQVVIPSNVTIRGETTGASKAIVTLPDLSPDPVFDLKDAAGVTIEDVTFQPATATGVSVIAFGSSTGSPSNLMMRRCNFEENGSNAFSSILKLDGSITDGLFGDLRLNGCHFHHRDKGIVFGSSFTGPNNVEITNCRFTPDLEGAPCVPLEIRANPGTNSLKANRVLIEGCRFGSCISGLVLVGPVEIRGCVLSCPVYYTTGSILTQRLTITDTVFDFNHFTTAFPLYAISIGGTSTLNLKISSVEIKWTAVSVRGTSTLRAININMGSSVLMRVSINDTDIDFDPGNVGLTSTSVGIYINNAAVTSSIILSGLRLRSFESAGNTLTTGIALVSASNALISGLHCSGCANQKAVTFDASSDDNVLNSAFVRQAGAGIGYTNGGAGNVTTNVSVFT